LQWAKKDLGDGYITWTPIQGDSYSQKNKRWLIDQGYRFNSIASACIQMIATSLPEAPLKVYREIEGEEPEVVEGHWLTELIRHPNDHTSTFELWEKTAIHLLAGGSSYWLLLRSQNGMEPEENARGPINRVELLRPDLVTPITDQGTGHIVGWLYRPEGTTQELRYPAYQVVATPFPDPLGNDGLSPLARVVREIGIDNGATDFVKQFFDNGAVVAGILSSEQELDKETAERIEERWYQKFGRWAKGRFRTAVLGKGTKYQQMALNFRDMEFESVRSFVETRICGAFGVDPVLLPSWVGIRHGGKYSNYQEARRHLWYETIIPLLKRIESKINSQLLVYEEGHFCRFDLSKVEALQENTNDLWERVWNAFQRDMLPLGYAQRALGVPVDEEKEELYYSELKSKGIQPEEGQQQEEEEEDDNNANSQRKAFRKKDINREKFTEAIRQVQDKHEEKIKGQMINFFKKAKGRVVDAAQKELTPNEYFMILLAIQEAVEELEGELRPVALTAFLEAALDGGVVAAGELGLDFDPDDKELRRKLREYSLVFAKRVMSTTRKDLLGLLAKAQEEKWTYTKLKDEIRAKFNQYSENRAQMIARTETVRMVNLGSATSYIQNGFFNLEWHAIHDKKTCPYCNKMDGKVTPVGVPFASVGDTITGEDEDGNPVSMTIDYANVEVPPLHPNCRCALLPA
jgi:HK97 family phage portal protein